MTTQTGHCKTGAIIGKFDYSQCAVCWHILNTPGFAERRAKAVADQKLAEGLLKPAAVPAPPSSRGCCG